MAFGFRKSVSLGKGVRMTFSKSGVSTSVGGKGYRLTAGPRGTYVTVGAGGVYYRQRVGGHLGPTPSTAQFPSSQPFVIPRTGTPIITADASQLVELSSVATLQQLNTVANQPTYNWMVIIGGIILSAILLSIHFILSVLILCLTLYVASIVKKMDIARRTFHLEYKLEPDAQQRWGALTQSFSALSRTQRLWRITTQDHTYDWKRNAGASSILTRTIASIQQKASPTIASNVMPHCMNIGGQQFLFFPDRLYVLQGGTYGAVEYSSLTLGTGQTRFIEDQGVPRDTQVVGETWRYVNKNGGPDRRFNNNSQIPIAQYGVLEFTSSTGLNILLHVSSVGAMNEFAGLFNSFQSPSKTYPNSQRSNYGSQPGPNPQHPGSHQKPPHQESPKQEQRSRQQKRNTNVPGASQPISTNCYQVLGLQETCTKEEASTKFRQLVMAYHPDRVNHMAPEFKELANAKLQEINRAYEELKRLRGW